MSEPQEPPRGIRFTQYLMPDGRTRDQWVKRPDEIELLAAQLEAQGCRFECEILRTGHVSLTCSREECDGETDVLAIEVCENGPGVLWAVDRLVHTASADLAKVSR